MGVVRARPNTSEWFTEANPILRLAEIGLELDTGKFKMGDGHTYWNDLSYVGGGSQPITCERFSSTVTVPINNGLDAFLPWEKSGGDDLLDLTDPTLPTVVEAGVYAIATTVNGSVLTTNGWFQVSISADFNGPGEFSISGDSRLSTVGGGNSPTAFLSLTYYLPAGATILVDVVNQDGADQRLFQMTTVLQRLS